MRHSQSGASLEHEAALAVPSGFAALHPRSWAGARGTEPAPRLQPGGCSLPGCSEGERPSSILQEGRGIFSPALMLLCAGYGVSPLIGLLCLFRSPHGRALPLPPLKPHPRSALGLAGTNSPTKTCPQLFKGFAAVNLKGRLLMPTMALFKH